MAKKGTRHGKHAEDKVILGAFVTPEKKALAMLVSSVKGCDVSSLIVDGIDYSATQIGFMRNGILEPDIQLQISAIASQIRENKKKRQARGRTNK